ncbi:hypothetical protein F2Q65_05070 [Thiohalocapsa marina]|uniref:HprK-related kinase A n=1 Tax=Thiohalocapsa marina TaxID=424902 RepID=A0A5M8FS32_9GAMM|nr:hypothetical protein [Thiohalocapsa marina]KAA6186741.1 hypothetical protein F2Q65_05070 [Thiohalocapsa marina]
MSESEQNLIGIRLANRHVAVQADCRAPIEALQTLFAGHLCPVGGSAAHQIRVHREPGGYRIEGGGPSMPQVLDEAQLPHVLCQALLHGLSNGEDQHLMLHAAALARGEQGILMAARSGSGKTTLSAWMIEHGYRFLTDELVAVDDRGMLHGLARPLNLKQRGASAVQGLGWLERQMPQALRSGPITLLPCEDTEPTPALATLMLFPRFVGGDEFTVEPMSPARCAVALTATLLNARNLPRRGLPRLLDLARQAQGYAVFYSHPSQVIGWLADELARRGQE